MTPEARIYPGGNYSDQASFLAALRRAKWMLFAVSAATAAFCLNDVLTDHVPDGWYNALKRDSGQIVFTLAMCWYAFRGGKVSGGCLAVGYTITLLTVGIGVGLAVGFHFEIHSLTRATTGERVSAVFSLIATWAWCVFSLWVLLGSKDVRLYREVRRLGFTPEEAFIRRGRVYGQRPQPSIHAS